MLHVLVVDDDSTLRLTVKAALATRGYRVSEAVDGQAAVDFVKEHHNSLDAVILDVNMPRLSGIDALAAIKEINPRIFCLVATAYADVKDAILAMKYGAYDYLEKPVETEKILSMIDQAVAANRLVEVAGNSAPILSFSEGRTMVGESAPIRKVYDVVYKLSRVDTSVLIRGESGTGKELVAQALHYNSHRKRGPFVAVNCAAIPEDLIESELFGHEKGSFTGADKKKIGKFQYADGGTIFLDEIGDMSLHMQVKLLRVLQEKRITAVGSNQEVAVDVRIVAATSRPIEDMIQKGSFRPDLFYRLNVLPIRLPSLRDRKEDIATLTQFMIEKFNKIHGRSVKGIDQSAAQALMKYPWPGNIRELENVIEHAFIVDNRPTISVHALPEHVQSVSSTDAFAGTIRTHISVDDGDDSEPTSDTGDLGILGVSEIDNGLNFPALKEKFEREFIIKALKAFKGRINQTAHHTQMTKVTLLRKLEKYGIDPRSYHQPK
jgi:two-component system response regulator HydG